MKGKPNKFKATRTLKFQSQSYSFNDVQSVKLNLSDRFQDGKEKVALTTKTSGGKEGKGIIHGGLLP